MYHAVPLPSSAVSLEHIAIREEAWGIFALWYHKKNCVKTGFLPCPEPNDTPQHSTFL